MKYLKLIILMLSLYSLNLISEESELLTTLPVTKEEFIKSEKKLIKTINWLEDTPIDTTSEKRKKSYEIVVAWLVNSPTITLMAYGSILENFENNSDLLIIFMGGYAKYSLENSYSNDEVKCNLAGLKSAIKVYKKGINIVKNENIKKIIEIDNKSELEIWVKNQIELEKNKKE